MDGAFDIPDSTDWLATPLKDIASLENALHCQICKEFYDTPMITSCAHTFCSKCIRTSLSTDGKCPACRTADQASKLRNNWALQEVVSTFLTARPKALEVAKREQEAQDTSRKPGKRKRAILDADDIAQLDADTRTTRRKSQRIAASQGSQPDTIEIEDSDGDETFEPDIPTPVDGLVDCPLGCGKRMKIEAVDPHLDRCEDEQKQASRAKSSTPVNGFPSSRSRTSQATPKPQERISELNYSLLNESKLRKRLDDLGIPAWGVKSLMTKRHTEWVNLWNANCDSNHPRTKRELLQDLDAWERSQGGRAPTVNGLASTVMRKDFDGAGWANRNKDNFDRLISEARAKKVKLPPDDSRSNRPEHATTESNSVESTATNPNLSHHESVNDGHQASGFGATGPIRRNTNEVAGSNTVNAGDFTAQQTNPTSLPKESSRDEHLSAGSTGTPCDILSHISASPVRKMPTFAMPQASMSDVDGGNGVGQ